MNDREKKELLGIFSGVLAVWGVLLFFESAYFGAFFYGVEPPNWTTWIAQVPIWTFNVIDTIMVVVLVVAIVLAVRGGRRRHARGSRGSAASTALLLVLVLAVLIVLGFTFTTFWQGVLRFFGI